MSNMTPEVEYVPQVPRWVIAITMIGCLGCYFAFVALLIS